MGVHSQKTCLRCSQESALCRSALVDQTGLEMISEKMKKEEMKSVDILAKIKRWDFLLYSALIFCLSLPPWVAEYERDHHLWFKAEASFETRFRAFPFTQSSGWLTSTRLKTHFSINILVRALKWTLHWDRKHISLNTKALSPCFQFANCPMKNRIRLDDYHHLMD